MKKQNLKALYTQCQNCVIQQILASIALGWIVKCSIKDKEKDE